MLPEVCLRLIGCLLVAAGQVASVSTPAPTDLSTSFPQQIAPRTFPVAPDGYTPKTNDCPFERPTIRNASHLSPNETAWLHLRRNNTIAPMKDLLARVNIPGFDAAAYITNNAKNASALPNIAVAVSGGGYRAMLNGGGAVKAFDSREVNSTAAGHLGGLLQSATYLAGLSGGGWLVGSIFVNNFTTISDLQYNNNASSLWELGNSIFEGPATGGLQLLDTADYFKGIMSEVDAKGDEGFNTSVTDYWGRALSFQLVNASDGGPAQTWSSIQQQDSFSSGQSPLPILIADGRAPGETLIPSNTTVYEFNPWELGSWDPTTFGFVPLQYLGSNFSGGSLVSSSRCVTGFDNVGYIMGTSSSLFNQFLLQVNQTSIPQLAKTFVTAVLRKFSTDNNDIAGYSPNPFYHYHNHTSPIAQSSSLTLVDGGEDYQNIPLHPLIQPNRHVDVIFAIDSSADTEDYWPNGTSLVATYQRSIDTSIANIANGTSFPAIPDTNTFVNLGLNTRPTFFGCNSSNTTHMTPLVVYLPNYPYVYFSNISTFDPKYNNSDRDAIVANGYSVATMGNGTADNAWPICVGCAILQRSMERTKTRFPDACTQCFSRYCWDGTTNATKPAPYEPKSKGTLIKVTSAASFKGVQTWSVMFLALAVVFGTGLL